MVRSKIRLALTALIILAICAGVVISTADAKGSTSGKSAGKTGKAAATGFNAAAIGKTTVSATPAFGSSVTGNIFSASGGVFGNVNNVVQGTPTGSFVNSLSQSFTPGVTATGQLQSLAAPSFGSLVSGNIFSAADNVFGLNNNLVQATPTGSFVNTFGQSFTPGVTATGQLQAMAAPSFGSLVSGNVLSAADNAFGLTNNLVQATRQGSFVDSFGQSFGSGVTATGQLQAAGTPSGSFVTADTSSIV
jgi:hypothetical protein